MLLGVLFQGDPALVEWKWDFCPTQKRERHFTWENDARSDVVTRLSVCVSVQPVH
jgi:hypothetical protein